LAAVHGRFRIATCRLPPPENRLTAMGQAERGTFNYDTPEATPMSLELEQECPECGETREFYRAASTTMHLGEKTKWHCPECDYGFVRIDDEVDTASA